MDTLIEKADTEPKENKKTTATLIDQIKEIEKEVDKLFNILEKQIPEKMIALANDKANISQKYITYYES